MAGGLLRIWGPEARARRDDGQQQGSLPVSDIFREIQEDVRREQIKKLWQAYGSYVIALVVLIFIGLGAWQLWQRHQKSENEKAALAFTAAQRITNPQQAANAFADMTTNAPAGYKELARLSEANAMYAAGQRKDAIDLYKQIADKNNGTVGAVARLRAGWGLADDANRADLAKLLAPLDRPGSAWRELAEEVLAYADYRALDLKAATSRYAALEKDPAAPDALRSRARAMAAFLGNGGAITYGTVPPDAMPAAGLPSTDQAAAAAADKAPAAPAK